MFAAIAAAGGAAWAGETPNFACRLDSRLIVLNGMIREEGLMGSHYFEFNGRALRPLKTIVRTEPPFGPPPGKPE